MEMWFRFLVFYIFVSLLLLNLANHACRWTGRQSERRKPELLGNMVCALGPPPGRVLGGISEVRRF